MTKETLSEVLVEKGLVKTKVGAREIVDEIFNSISNELANGEEVSIYGFGKFKIKETSERVGRNPQTGEEITIPARNKVKFTVAKGLQERI